MASTEIDLDELQRVADAAHLHDVDAVFCNEDALALVARVRELEALLVDMDGHDGGPNDLSWDCLQFALEEKHKRLKQMHELEAKSKLVDAWRAVYVHFRASCYPSSGFAQRELEELLEKAEALDREA